MARVVFTTLFPGQIVRWRHERAAVCNINTRSFRSFTLCVVCGLLASEQLALVSFMLLRIIRRIAAWRVNLHRVGVHWQKLIRWQ